jgi:enoyl-CoA hydratase/carnithine racemase
MEPLIAEDRGPVRVLRMNRPGKRNALNNALTNALWEALRAADGFEQVGAVVLAGNGSSFCAGADTSEFHATETNAPDAIVARAELTGRLHLIFTEMAKPVVGAVQGYAMGGGAGLALACDLLVMADNAKIGYPELKHGIVPAIVMSNLIRQVGPKAAFELVSLGTPVDAQRALALGMANRVVPETQLMEEAIKLAQTLAESGRLAMKIMKRLFYRVADLPLESGIAAGCDANVMMRFLRDSSGNP